MVGVVEDVGRARLVGRGPVLAACGNKLPVLDERVLCKEVVLLGFRL